MRTPATDQLEETPLLYDKSLLVRMPKLCRLTALPLMHRRQSLVMDWLDEPSVTAGSLVEAPSAHGNVGDSVAHLVGSSPVSESESVCGVTGECGKVVLAIEAGLVEVVGEVVAAEGYGGFG